MTQSERSTHLKRTSPYTITNARRVACNNAHLNAPILLRNIFVSVNMEFFCRINNKPRNALPVMLYCIQYGRLLDLKNIADAIVCACKELLRNLSE